MMHLTKLLKMPYKTLKRVLGACLLIGAIAYYTAYQAAPVVKEMITDTIEQQFEDARVRQASGLGSQVIVAYESALNNPTVHNINELYALVELAQDKDTGVLTAAGGGGVLISEKDKIAVSTHIGKLGFSEKPVRSGLQVAFAIFLISYLAWVLGKAIWFSGSAIYGMLKNRKKNQQASLR